MVWRRRRTTAVRVWRRWRAPSMVTREALQRLLESKPASEESDLEEDRDSNATCLYAEALGVSVSAVGTTLVRRLAALDADADANAAETSSETSSETSLDALVAWAWRTSQLHVTDTSTVSPEETCARARDIVRGPSGGSRMRGFEVSIHEIMMDDWLWHWAPYLELWETEVSREWGSPVPDEFVAAMTAPAMTAASVAGSSSPSRGRLARCARILGPRSTLLMFLLWRSAADAAQAPTAEDEKDTTTSAATSARGSSSWLAEWRAYLCGPSE